MYDIPWYILYSGDLGIALHGQLAIHGLLHLGVSQRHAIVEEAHGARELLGRLRKLPYEDTLVTAVPVSDGEDFLNAILALEDAVLGSRL